MSVSVIRLENEPILIATLSGVVTVEMVLEVFSQSAELMGDNQHIFHRITDVRTADSNFLEMLGVIKEAASTSAGSTMDPRIRTTFVGTTTWMNFFRNAMMKPQFGGKKMGAFDNMDDALTSVRIQIENERKSDAS